MDIFDYDHVQLLPRQCRVNSRSECDPSIQFGPRRFKIPAVPANMKTVIDEPIAEMLRAKATSTSCTALTWMRWPSPAACAIKACT